MMAIGLNPPECDRVKLRFRTENEKKAVEKVAGFSIKGDRAVFTRKFMQRNWSKIINAIEELDNG